MPIARTRVHHRQWNVCRDFENRGLAGCEYCGDCGAKLIQGTDPLGGDAIRVGERGEVRIHQIGSQRSLLAHLLLRLQDSEPVVVEEQHEDREVALDCGSQFLDVELKAAVTRYNDDRAFRARRLGSNCRR